MRQMTVFDFIKPHTVQVKGMCDDPYCPKCNYWLDDPRSRYGECPKCGAQIDFMRWFDMNGKEQK